MIQVPGASALYLRMVPFWDNKFYNLKAQGYVGPVWEVSGGVGWVRVERKLFYVYTRSFRTFCGDVLQFPVQSYSIMMYSIQLKCASRA